MKQVSPAMSGLVAISRMTLVGAYHPRSATAQSASQPRGVYGKLGAAHSHPVDRRQRKQIKDTSGKDVIALDFSVEELEQRIAPTGASYNTWGWDIKANKGA